jgi:multidrug transporter EmrE-like cation transporter
MNIWFIIGSISAIVPIILIKEYIKTKNLLFLILTFFCYLLLIKSYLNIFNTNQVSTSYTFIQLLQILIVVFAGVLLFKEKLTLKMSIGIILALFAMYFLNR